MSGLRLFTLIVSIVLLSSYSSGRFRADDDVTPTYWLGVVTRPLDAPLRAQTRLSNDRGLLVDSVAVDGPAHKAGVRQYDIIVAVDDDEVGASNPVDEAWDTHSGDAVTLKLLRQGEIVERALTPEPASELSIKHHGEPPLHGIRHPYLNQLRLDLKPISDTVRRQLPEPYTGGVEVTYVQGGMPADLAGFKPGDVIVGLEKWEIRDLNDVQWVLDSEGGFDRFYIARGDESGREILVGSMELAGIPGGSLLDTELESKLEDLMEERNVLITHVAELELVIIESRLEAIQGDLSQSEDLDALRRARHLYNDLDARKRAFEDELLVVDTKIAYLKRHIAEMKNE